MDFYYDELQFFNGVTSRSRESLFFSNYTHLVNRVYPLSVDITSESNSIFGLWGDRHHKPSQDIKPSRQATNFTQCPVIWNLLKVEASVYPIDGNFNMCGKESFYHQSLDTSIDCELTETIGYGFMAVGAVTLVMMYGASFMMIYFKSVPLSMSIKTDIEVDDKIEGGNNKLKDKLKVIGLCHEILVCHFFTIFWPQV